jgi:hypothetical protein
VPAHPDTVLRRLTDRLAPLEQGLHRAWWAAATDARPETSAARQRAQEAWLAALGDPELFAEVQGLRRPAGRTAPDWATKIHLAAAPVYYQSYLLGELLASQLDRPSATMPAASSAAPPPARSWPNGCSPPAPPWPGATWSPPPPAAPWGRTPSFLAGLDA